MLRLRGLARCRRPAGRAACGAPRALSALAKAETDKAKKPKQSLSSLALAGEVLRLAKPERPLLAAGTAGLLVAAGVSMYVPTALGTVIDLVTGQRVDTDVATYSLFLGGALAAGGAAAFVRVLAFQLAGQRLVARVRRRLFGALLEREVEFFDRNRTGELVSRLASDTAEMSRSLAGPQLSQGLRSAAQALAGFGYMFYLSPELTGVVTGVVPVAAGGAFLYGRFVKRLSGRVQDALAEATAVAEERLGNVRTVRAFVQEEAARRHYGEAVDRVYQLAKKEALAGATFFSSSTLVGYAGVLGVLLYGGSSGALTGGALTSFLLYTAMVGGSVLSLSSFYSELMKSFGAADRVVKLLRASPAAAARAAGEVPGAEPRGEVRFEGVSFRYPTRPDAPVLRGLDLEVPANSSLAVVGRSGGGKSTLAALLLRFYEPGEGAVLLDGRPVAELDAAWLRRHIGYVSQDPALFDASIRENIAYGRPDATDEEIERAARDASAHEFCAALPDGYDTRVGNASLSGGQRQRVAIARALLKDPRLLILDEATSALDSKSERLVQDALQRLRRGRTVIVIAHRLSTVVSADRIAVLDGGAVAELGTHAELSARPDSLYTELMRHGDLAPPAAATDEGEAGDEVPGLAPEGAVK